MYKLLAECRKIEENANRIYKLLAKNEHYPQKLKDLFISLSTDELEHARVIELAMHASQKELDAMAYISWNKINEAVTLSEKYLQQAQKNLVSEEESLKMAIDMEQTFVKIHVQNALYFNDNKLNNLFQSLEDEDQKHIDTLKSCLAWWREDY
jgi:rubrerythrin